MAATTATQLLLLHKHSSPPGRRHSDRISAGRFSDIFAMSSSSRSSMILASKKDDASVNIQDTPDPAPLNSQVDDDVLYVLKLAGGSVVGAVIVKYGSVLYPDITTPNILQALTMISVPVILALFLLIKKSTVN